MALTLPSKLMHHGVKGMHWGQRKADSGSSPKPIETRRGLGGVVKAKGGRGHEPHGDAIAAAISKQVARKNSTDALSNKELQDLVTRLNLEQQYSRLVKSHDGRTSGSDVNVVFQKAMGANKTLKDVNTFLDTPQGKLVKTAVKTAVKTKLGK